MNTNTRIVQVFLVAVTTLTLTLAPAARAEGREPINYSGVWAPCRQAGDDVYVVLGKIDDTIQRARVRSVLGRLGYFSRQVKVAHCDEHMTIVCDDRRGYSVPIEKRGQSLSGLGRRARWRKGLLAIEEQSGDVGLRATLALVANGAILCQAIEIWTPGRREPLVLRHVLKSSASNDRLPNPWKEPPSILPSHEKRRGSPIRRLGDNLLKLGLIAGGMM